MQIAFDPAKDAANQDKHGVSLAYATEVLADTNRLDMLDVRFDYAEERFISYGAVDGRVWVCIFTMRDGTHRIISAPCLKSEARCSCRHCGGGQANRRFALRQRGKTTD